MPWIHTIFHCKWSQPKKKLCSVDIPKLCKVNQGREINLLLTSEYYLLEKEYVLLVFLNENVFKARIKSQESSNMIVAKLHD